MIKVLHVFGVMNMGGAETMIMNIYRNIDKSKVQFDFLCMSDSKGDYEEEIKSMGGKIYKIKPPSQTGYIGHIKAIIDICKNKGPYEAIHIPTMFHSGIVCLAAYIAKVPKRIVHSHSTSDAKKTLKRNIYNFVCRCLINIFSSTKIACGEAAGKFLFGEKAVKKNKVKILKNGISVNDYSSVNSYKQDMLRKEFGFEDDELIIGHVGRFSNVKNHAFFIELAKKMKEKRIKFKILLVGDGELKEKIEQQIYSNNLERYFLLTGKRNDIPLIMNIIDVFVMPSLYEGFPMVIIEALAANKKCVVSDTISKEVEIEKNSVSFLDINGEMELWVSEIIKKSNESVNKEDRIKILKDNGFSIDNTVEELEEIYLA